MNEWQHNAEELAAWAERNMVNRRDAWGLHVDATPKFLSGRLTTPRLKDRGKRYLTTVDIVQHFRNPGAGRTMGLHAIGPDGMCRWFCIDIDAHSDIDTELPQRNEAAAVAWWSKLQDMGFEPLLLDSNGAGGFHLLTLIEPTPSEQAYDFAQSIVDDYESFGIDRPETYPKQSRLESGRKYGNWLRLPGKHHSRDHWSRVWDGEWIDGEDAIAMLLESRPAASSLIPPVRAKPTPATVFSPIRITSVTGRGPITAMRIGTSPNGAIAVVVSVCIEQVSEQVGDQHEWFAAEPFDVAGTFWLMRKDQTLNEKVAMMLVDSSSWDGVSFDIFESDDSDFGRCQAILTKDALSRELVATWLRPFDARIGLSDGQRIERYMATLPTGMIAGAGRSDAAYAFACFMVGANRVSDSDALAWLRTWNSLQAEPLDDNKLTSTISNAHKYKSGNLAVLGANA